MASTHHVGHKIVPSQNEQIDRRIDVMHSMIAVWSMITGNREPFLTVLKLNTNYSFETKIHFQNIHFSSQQNSRRFSTKFKFVLIFCVIYVTVECWQVQCAVASHKFDFSFNINVGCCHLKFRFLDEKKWKSTAVVSILTSLFLHWSVLKGIILRFINNFVLFFSFY